MTGVDSWKTTPLDNETIDGTTTWKEHQLPSTVNNSMRRVLTDIRERFNDLPWFQYGTGSGDTTTHLAVPSVYASGTSFTITGADVTEPYHAGRPVRAIGTSTGTIYGLISSSSYSAGEQTTTVNVSWFSGSLSNEDLYICIGLPVIAFPSTFVITSEHQTTGTIATGRKGAGVVVPWNFEILGYYLIANTSGSMVLDIWAKAFAADDPPTVANTITASAKPTLSSQQQKYSATLTGWTTSFSTSPTMLRFYVDSATTVGEYTIVLYCRRI